jgi:protein TonB
MKLAPILGVVCAVLLHLGFILFGGILFMKHEEEHATLREVDLVSAEEEAKEEQKPEEETPAEKPPEMEDQDEQPPDAAELLKDLDQTPTATPALEAASLSAIEDALNGAGGGGDFSEAVSFASGGRIGGLGKPGGAMEEKLESAFSLSEIDQKPRAVFQASPVYPAQLRIFVVDSGGKVASPRVEKSNHDAFNKPAVDAVKQWKFEPAVRGGQRVPCKMRVPIRFPAS